MTDSNHFDVIIIGGSYSGLSAAMSLGRALRSVLVIDAGQPCNRQAPHSHNFLTRDGETPQEIARIGKEQVARYTNVKFFEGFAVTGVKTTSAFTVTVQSGQLFSAKKLIFATGLKDSMPDIEGFSESWGRSIIHCPYCHGYEVKNEKTGILANGDDAFHYAQLISNWTKDLTVFTNGKSTLTEEQLAKMNRHSIRVVETEIGKINQTDGQIESLVLKDESVVLLKAIYTRLPYVQHSDIPEKLGCELTAQGLLVVDDFKRTTVDGVYSCGDNSHMRSVPAAVASGSMVGAALNNFLIMEEF